MQINFDTANNDPTKLSQQKLYNALESYRSSIQDYLVCTTDLVMVYSSFHHALSSCDDPPY